jgi:hypothetical protein
MTLKEKSSALLDHFTRGVIGLPVTHKDVMFRIMKKYNDPEYPMKSLQQNRVQFSEHREVINLWYKCGKDKSLNEILEGKIILEDEYLEKYGDGRFPVGIGQETFENKDVQELFELLLDIFEEELLPKKK